MKAVHKYEIPGARHPDFALELPVDAEVIDVRTLNGKPYLFALSTYAVEGNQCGESRRFIVVGEGQNIDDRAKEHDYIGSYVQRVVSTSSSGLPTAPQETVSFVFEVMLPLTATARRAEGRR